MEEKRTVRKTDEELEQEMYLDQFITFLADMYIKYADKMQPIIEAREEELRKQGSSLKQEWEKVKRNYNKAMSGIER